MEASVATRSKMSERYQYEISAKWIFHDIPLTKEFRMDMARLEIPVSGWTCFRTADTVSVSGVDGKHDA